MITPSLPRDGGTARTAIQVHAVNLIEVRLGQGWATAGTRAELGTRALLSGTRARTRKRDPFSNEKVNN